MRDTCQRKRAQMNSRKYQRHIRNWNSGRLTKPYHIPASVSTRPPVDGVAYHVVVARAPYCRQTTRMPNPYTKVISRTSASAELRNRKADATAASKRGIAVSGTRLRSRNCCSSGRIRR